MKESEAVMQEVFRQAARAGGDQQHGPGDTQTVPPEGVGTATTILFAAHVQRLAGEAR